VLGIAIVASCPPLAIDHVACSLGAPYTLELGIVNAAHGCLISRVDSGELTVARTPAAAHDVGAGSNSGYGWRPVGTRSARA